MVLVETLMCTLDFDHAKDWLFQNIESLRQKKSEIINNN